MILVNLTLPKEKKKIKIESSFSPLENAPLWGTARVYLKTAFVQYLYICDLFFETPSNIEFAGYADDNTPYTYSSDIQTVLETIEKLS